MAKEAAVTVRWAGDVDPSRFLIVLTGDLSGLESSLGRGLALCGDRLVDHVLLARAHDRLLAGLEGQLATRADITAGQLALGTVETHTVCGIVRATDRALKAAPVSLVRLRFATHLGGQGHSVLAGDQSDVEAALEAARQGEEAGITMDTTLIPRPATETADAAALGRDAYRAFSPLGP